MSRERQLIAALLSLALALLSCNALPRSGDEEERIVSALALELGQTVADVGAGDGRWSVPLARAVGGEGTVFASEVDAEEIAKMRRRFADAELPQVALVEGDQETTGLGERCCDAILLRLVYHHFEQPQVMLADLVRALKPGGRLLVVEIAPQTSWRRLPGVPERGGHGIELEDLIAELAVADLVPVERFLDWPGDEDRYAVLFRLARPSSPPPGAGRSGAAGDRAIS